jgi:2-phosphoglycolate phosphatase
VADGRGGALKPFGAIAFDLDGTLVDSRLDLAAAVNTVRAELGFPGLPVERVMTFVGRGARSLVRRSLPEEVAGGDFDAAYERFLELYYDRCLEQTRPYPGVESMLEALAAELPLAVVTNKPARHTRRILEGLGLAPWLRFALGGDSLPERKPDPEPLREAGRRLGVDPGRLLYVGDSAIDGETARRAGSPAALVTWGFGTPGELARCEAMTRPESPEALVRWIAAGRSAPAATSPPP